MTLEEVLQVAQMGAEQGCTEVLFTLGEECGLLLVGIVRLKQWRWGVTGGWGLGGGALVLHTCRSCPLSSPAVPCSCLSAAPSEPL